MKKKMDGRLTGLVLAGVLAAAALTGCEAETEAKTSGGDGVTVVKVGTGNNSAPFCYLDEDGNPIGYDLDVLKELDKRLEKYEFDIQTMEFSTLVVSIDSGAIDMISHQLVKSETRKEKYLFPAEYYCLSPMSLCVRSDSGIKGMDDMGGKTMEQNPSAYEYQMMMAYNEANPDKEVEVIGVSDQSTADAYKKVSNGQVDAALTYKATYDSVMKDLGITNLTLTDVVMCEDTYMMFSKDQTELVAAVSQATKEMKEDGTLGEISKKWFNGEDVFASYADMITIVAE